MRAWWLPLAVLACSPASRDRPDGGGPGDPDAATGTDAPLSSACAAAAAVHSYIGCRYWPVDLANAIEVMGPPQGTDCSMYGTAAVMLPATDVCAETDGTYAGRCDPGGTCPGTGQCQIHDACGLDAQHSPFAVVAANVGEDPADVTLADAHGTTATATVAPGATHTFAPQALGFEDHSLDAPGISASAYRLTSTRPVVAYQLNPLDDVGVFSNDASLLLPEQTFDTSFYALSYPNMVRRPQSSDWHSYLTVVAAQDAQVDVTPTTAALAGGAQIAAGETRSFSLHAFETLQVVAVTGDISGSRVTSTQPIGVFSGHEATVIADPFPFRGPCCADHLEEQVYPTSTWGKVYAIARGRERATQIHDYVRVLAQHANTVFQATPASAYYSSCTGTLLQAGQVCELYLNADIELHANEPVLVGHYMVSGGGLGPQSGDPSLAYVSPTDQFRKSYTIVVPDQYDANDLTMVTPYGGQVLLDGADVTLLFTGFASTTWTAARIAVPPGPHQITCPLGCSVEVSGWNTAVSYLYSGGLDLAPIVQ